MQQRKKLLPLLISGLTFHCSVVSVIQMSGIQIPTVLDNSKLHLKLTEQGDLFPNFESRAKAPWSWG